MFFFFQSKDEWIFFATFATSHFSHMRSFLRHFLQRTNLRWFKSWTGNYTLIGLGDHPTCISYVWSSLPKFSIFHYFVFANFRKWPSDFAAFHNLPISRKCKTGRKCFVIGPLFFSFLRFRLWLRCNSPCKIRRAVILRKSKLSVPYECDCGAYDIAYRVVFKWLSKNQNQSNYFDQSQQERTARWTNQNS